MKNVLFICVSLFLVSPFVLGEDISQEDQFDYTEDISEASSDWVFKITPYAWMPTKMTSTSTLSGLTGTLELSCQDIIDNLGMIWFTRVEAWKDDTWGFSYDTVYMYLQLGESFTLNRSAKREIAGPRFNRTFQVNVNADVALNADVRLWMNDFAAHYRLIDRRFGDGNKERFIFEPYGGFRYVYIKQEATIEQSTNIRLSSSGTRPGAPSVSRSASSSGKQKIGDSRDYVEPLIGTRFVWELNDKFSLNFRGDVGGFGVGSDLTYQLIPGCSYKLSDNTTFDFSYRYANLDYSDGSGTDELAMDLEAYGPSFGLTIVF